MPPKKRKTEKRRPNRPEYEPGPLGSRTGNNLDSIRSASNETIDMVLKAMIIDLKMAAPDFIPSIAGDILNVWRMRGFEPPIEYDSICGILHGLNSVHAGFQQFEIDAGQFAAEAAILQSDIAQENWGKVTDRFSSVMSYIGQAFELANKSYIGCSATCEKLQEQLTTLNNRIAADTQAARKREDEYNATVTSLKEAEKQLDIFGKELEALNEKHQALVKERDNDKQRVTETNEQYERRIRDLNAAIDEKTGAYNDLSQKHDQLVIAATSMRAERDALLADRNRSMQILGVDRSWNKSLSDVIKQLIDEQVALKEKLTNADIQLNVIIKELANVKPQLQQYADQMEEDEEFCVQQIRELVRQGEEMSKLQQERDQLQNDVNGLTELLELATGEKNIQARELLRMSRENQEARLNLTQLSAARESISKLEKQKTDLQKTIKEKDKLIQQWKDASESWKAKAAVAAQDHERIQRLYTELEGNYSDLESKYNLLQESAGQAQAASAANAVGAVQNNLLDLQSQEMLANLSNENATLSNDIERLRQENIRLTSDNENLRTRNQRLQDRSQRRKAVIIQLRENARGASDTIDRLQDDLWESLDERRQVVNELNNRIRELENNLAEALAGGAGDADMVEVEVNGPIQVPLENQARIIALAGPVRPLVRVGVPPRVPARIPRPNPAPVPAPGRGARVMLNMKQEEDPLSPAAKRARNTGSGGYVVGGRPDPNLSSAGVAFWKNVYKNNYRLF